MSPDKINVSLEPHLLESIKEIYPLLPNSLKDSFSQFVASDTPKKHIPYNLLQELSKWTRTPSASSHGIQPSSYTMVCLLAGTTTSPERQLGTYVPPPDPEELERQRKNERKAIATLANAVLSVGGVGAGAWWASSRSGWKDEWRALFALFAAIVVAIAEAGLYLIYLWKLDAGKVPEQRQKKYDARHKKVDPPSHGAEVNINLDDHDTGDQSSNELRLRK